MCFLLWVVTLLFVVALGVLVDGVAVVARVVDLSSIVCIILVRVLASLVAVQCVAIVHADAIILLLVVVVVYCAVSCVHIL